MEESSCAGVFASTLRCYKKFQVSAGVPANGILSKPQWSPLAVQAGTRFAQWALQNVANPKVPISILIPTGIGIHVNPSKSSDSALEFNHPNNLFWLRYEFSSDTQNLDDLIKYTDELFGKKGSSVDRRVYNKEYAITKYEDPQGMTAYVQYHKAYGGIIGFSAAFNWSKANFDGDSIIGLMSASLWANVEGKAFFDPSSMGAKTSQVAANHNPPPPRGTSSAAVAAPPVRALPAATQPGADKPISTGTGFFTARDGTFVTNAHVIDGCSVIKVRTEDAIPRDAGIIARDNTNDLAILRVVGTFKDIASLRLSGRLGENVAVFGFPHIDRLSSSGNFTLGNIAALSGVGDDSRFYQISAPVQSGNSGGPLLDSSGNVVGVVTSKLNALKVALSDGDLPQNVNFAVKSSILATFLDANHIKIESKKLGITLDPSDLADIARSISGLVYCR